MSEPNPNYVPASVEFVNLCQSQISLLTQGFGATWSAVYLTPDLVENATAQLVPIVIYPETATAKRYSQRIAQLPQALENGKKTPLLLAATLPSNEDNSQQSDETDWEEYLFMQQRQVVLPLIYEELVMGLLVTGRDDRAWNERELTQLHQVAKTLGIACILDRRQNWYKQQLSAQQHFQQQQHDRFDDLLHQVRNPLTALRTFGKLLFKRLLPGDKNRNFAESIIRESDRLQELLQQMDSYVDLMDRDSETLTLETTSLPLLPTPPSLLPGNSVQIESFPITQVLEPLLNSGDAIAQEKGLTLNANIPPSLPPVEADSRALREVLNNLLDNAFKYTPEGGEVIVEAGLERDTPTGKLQGIAIRDNGVGIPLEVQDRIFERHYRGVQGEGEIPGSGLGLAIAKELIAQMNGEIELISPTTPEGKGTTFIVWLPSLQSTVNS